MLSRIQSLFLLCTAIATGLLFFMPVAYIFIPGTSANYDFYTSKVMLGGNPQTFVAWNWMSLILNSVITALALITIFVRKKKPKTVKPTLFLQFRLCVVNIILQLGLIVLMLLQLYQRTQDSSAWMQEFLHVQGAAEWHMRYGFILPVVGILFTWLALRHILKDISLLKSFDRIR